MTGTTALQEWQADLPSVKSTNSYWHKSPSKVLLGHRTTKDLPATADVVIVGSGITGAMAARSLKEGWAEDASVVMLEAREACWGATGRNGGHCQPIIYAPPPHIALFELQTFSFLRDLVATNSIPCNWVSTTGVHAFWTHDLFSRAAARVAVLPPDLAAAARLVTDAEELEALGVPGAIGAVVQANAAGLWPYKLVSWVLEDLLRRFGERHFNLQTKTPVTRLQRLGDGEGARWVVHTPRGQVAARHVLLASNGYTSHLLPSFAELIVPVQGQVAALLPKTGPPPQLGHTYVFLALPSATPVSEDYLIQRYGTDHELVFGGGRTLGSGGGIGVSSDENLDPVVGRYLRNALNEALDVGLESAEEMKALFEWTGIMAFSRDGRPWVGNVPEGLGGGDGLWMCAGYTGHGMPQASLSAKAVVEMMGGAEPKDVNLPPEFVVSESRAQLAKGLDSIQIQDEKGMFTV